VYKQNEHMQSNTKPTDKAQLSNDSLRVCLLRSKMDWQDTQSVKLYNTGLFCPLQRLLLTVGLTSDYVCVRSPE
jgi:hypothetical protein